VTGLLNGDEIRAANIIRGSKESGFRGTSYDVHIAKIIGPKGDLLDKYELPSQGIAEVLSEERFCLPMDITGYALVKTSLCNEGLLALNIGIIDPGYEGKLSSALVNFGKNNRLLCSGETFLRLTFHRTTPVDAKTKPKASVDEEYIREKQKRTVSHFSEYFLNIKDLVHKTTDEAMQRWRTTLLWWVPGCALALTIFTFLLNYGALWSIQRVFQPAEINRADLLREQVGAQNKAIDDTTEQFRIIMERMDKLDAQIQTLKPPSK
jgi:deoxycytidine triphosphate deaminase